MKGRGFFLFIMFLCYASLNIYGQKQKIPMADYYKAIQSAERTTKTFSHRARSEGKTFRENEKKPYLLRKWLSEFQLPNRTRSFLETRRAEKSEAETTDIIEIGNFQYTRNNNGEWKARRLHGGFNNLPISSLWKFENEEFYLTKDVKLNSRKANLYEYIAKTKVFRLQIEGAPPPKPIDVHHTEKRWISTDGLLLKVEIISNVLPTNLTSDLTHSVINYEYDSRIKIKAPIPEPQANYWY